MEVAQSLNCNSIVNEFMSFDFDGESLHTDESEFSKTLEDAINNNSIQNIKTPFPNLTSPWLNDFTSVGNSKRFGIINDEIVITSEGFPGKSDSEDLANGLSITYLNNWFENPFSKSLENRSDFTGSQAVDANDGQLVGDDFVLTKSLELAKESKMSPQKRKLTETLTNNDEIDCFVKGFDEIDGGMRKTREDRSFETANFEMKKPKHSGLGVESGENKLCIQTDRERKNRKLSDEVDVPEFGTTNLASTVSTKAKGMTQLISVGGRRRSRSDTKTRNRRCVQTVGIDDSSPVPSPVAEVPSLSPVNPTEYIDDEELMTLDTKELNRRLKYLSKTIVDEIKHRRRTLKNRGYARSCREKKIDETSTLQRSNCDLEKELASKELELELALLQRNEWKHKYKSLVSAFKERGIKVEA